MQTLSTLTSEHTSGRDELNSYISVSNQVSKFAGFLLEIYYRLQITVTAR